jgi:hypothetical protein
MIGCFYDHGRWVTLHLQCHPQTGDPLVIARVGDCPGDADGRDVPLAGRPSAGAALDRALGRLTAGWQHACEEPPAAPASVRAAICHRARLRVEAPVDRAGTTAQARAVVAYVTTADEAGFCFFGNPVAR